LKSNRLTVTTDEEHIAFAGERFSSAPCERSHGVVKGWQVEDGSSTKVRPDTATKSSCVRSLGSKNEMHE
jgi:hypothetical protein